MLGLEGYGSDNSDSESPATRPRPIISSSPQIPTPSLTLTSDVTKLGPSKLKHKRAVFTVAKPSKRSSDDEEERPVKKPRLSSLQGAGSSSLLAMLPPPSKVAATPPRMLGSAAQHGNGTGVIVTPQTGGLASAEASTDFSAQRTDKTESKSTHLYPPILAKTKIKKPQATLANSNSETPAVDFFSLGSSTPRPTPAPSTMACNDPPDDIPSTSVTSAPAIPTYEPPPPTPSDPYPGYYQLASGQWAMYDPDFYKKHYEKWYPPDGKSQKGFEGADADETVEIDAQQQLDLARKEREQRKSLTINAGGGPTAPKMNIKPPKIGSRARTRHQLSALLTEAYENREALEEKIAQGRRNRKEAGNKYGF